MVITARPAPGKYFTSTPRLRPHIPASPATAYGPPCLPPAPLSHPLVVHQATSKHTCHHSTDMNPNKLAPAHVCVAVGTADACAETQPYVDHALQSRPTWLHLHETPVRRPRSATLTDLPDSKDCHCGATRHLRFCSFLVACLFVCLLGCVSSILIPQACLQTATQTDKTAMNTPKQAASPRARGLWSGLLRMNSSRASARLVRMKIKFAYLAPASTGGRERRCLVRWPLM